MKTVKSYHGLYLKCEVFLLADVFEKFTNNSLMYYELFPSHYLSASCLSWDSMLNITKHILKRLGFSDISNRYSNKYLNPYSPKQESKHIIYLDANNLYVCAMSKFIPASGFK